VAGSAFAVGFGVAGRGWKNRYNGTRAESANSAMPAAIGKLLRRV
jgi:hypothetical protein